MIFIADKSVHGQRTNLREVARGLNSPEAFTAKILQTLTKCGWIHSRKGPGGGFEANPKKISKVTLADIVEAIDGPGIFSHCVLGLETCSDTRPCPVHHKFLPLRNNLLSILQHTSLLDVSATLNLQKTFIRS